MVVTTKAKTDFLVNAAKKNNKSSLEASSFLITAVCLTSLATMGIGMPPNRYLTPRRAKVCKEAANNSFLSLEVIRQLEDHHCVNFLTNDARLLALIKNNPGNTLKFYLTSSGLSQRWFYIAIEKLLKTGLIEKLSCETDARSKVLR